MKEIIDIVHITVLQNHILSFLLEVIEMAGICGVTKQMRVMSLLGIHMPIIQSPPAISKLLYNLSSTPPLSGFFLYLNKKPRRLRRGPIQQLTYFSVSVVLYIPLMFSLPSISQTTFPVGIPLPSEKSPLP